MRRIRALVSLLAGMVLLSGCSKGQVAPVVPPVVAPASPAPVNQPPAARELTADEWNEISFDHLKAGRWAAAVEAGEKALQLKPDHPFALYNTGLARLEAGQYCDAGHYLKASADAQKDRYEPLAALARLSQAGHDYALAAHYAARAVELSRGSSDALAVQQAVAAMRDGGAPADVAAKSALTLADGPVRLYLYREQQKGCNGTAPHTLYAVTAGGQSMRLPVGQFGEIPPQSKLVKTALPGGATGYWLELPIQVGAEISYAVQWRLFTLKATALGQVVFQSAGQPGLPPLRDFVASASQPDLRGDVIISGRRDEASGTASVSTPWRFSADLRIAVGTGAEERTMEGKLLQVGQAIRIQPTGRIGVLQDQYKFDFALPPDVQVFGGDQPLTSAALQINMMVRLTWQDGKLVRIDILR